MYYRIDPTYILVLIGVVLSLLASARVKSTFARYQRVRNRAGLTGHEAAERQKTTGNLIFFFFSIAADLYDLHTIK